MIPLPIETERLSIRRLTPEDGDALAALYADPEVTRYIPAHAAKALLERYARVEREHGFTMWAVVDRASGAFLGSAGFGVRAATGEPELGYGLARAAWGKGYASEAAQACLDAAFEHLDVRRIVALVDVENDASLRVAERIGMHRVDVVDADGRPHILFAKERL